MNWSEEWASYGEPLTPEEFNDYNNSQFTDWNITWRGTETFFNDIIYYYYINTFFYWIDETNTEWIIPVRETQYISCYELLNCTDHITTELFNTLNNNYYYLLDLQGWG